MKRFRITGVYEADGKPVSLIIPADEEHTARARAVAEGIRVNEIQIDNDAHLPRAFAGRRSRVPLRTAFLLLLLAVLLLYVAGRAWRQHTEQVAARNLAASGARITCSTDGGIKRVRGVDFRETQVTASDLAPLEALSRLESLSKRGPVKAVARRGRVIEIAISNADPPRGWIDPFGIDDLKPAVEQRVLAREFGQWLSRHVVDETHEVDYVVTQYLAEYVLTKGFDGILYPSAMGDGVNLVLFDPTKAAVGPVEQHRIISMSVKYEWKPAKDCPPF